MLDADREARRHLHLTQAQVSAFRFTNPNSRYLALSKQLYFPPGMICPCGPNRAREDGGLSGGSLTHRSTSLTNGF